MENVKQYLAALESDPKAAELLKAGGQPANAQEFAAIHAGIAAKLGFAVTEEEILQYMEELQKEVAGGSDEAAEEVRELSADELDKVAGGKDHPDCQDTYKNQENCFNNDGCDVAYHKYNYYRCAHSYHGGKSMCDYFIVYEF